MKALFDAEKIEYFGVIPFSACDCRRPDFITRRGISPSEIRSVIPFLIPYYVHDEAGNVSLYARSRDYHAYAEGLFSRILPKLAEAFGGRFLGFADKSPIQENLAAAMAGLGVIGDNFMLINEAYGSFVFMAEILSTVPPETLGYTGKLHPISSCSHCGACKRACPMTGASQACLSAVTQKKGELTREEEQYIRQYGSVWGCDICQLVCPMNRAVLAGGRETPLAFFREERIPILTAEALSQMDEEAFRQRAFSWRGREVLIRNLGLFERESE